MDTRAGKELSTTFAYDVKGMRIIKDGPYGKSIYVDTGYVLSGASTSLSNPASSTSAPVVMSNHVFVGNTRVASIVKHKDEPQPATYYYATDHLGSSSVLTNQQGSYHERIVYLPYGETWVEDKSNSSTYSTPYKFTSKEYDQETGYYYFGYRYYDPKLGRWISVDPALQKFLPLGKNENLPAGGVFRSVNLSMYVYAGNNPMINIDPDGKWDNRIHYGDNERGTLRWAMDSGFSESEARRIASACNSVDDITSLKSPAPKIGDQSRHFNTGAGRNVNDTRFKHAMKNLDAAIKREKDALRMKAESLSRGGIMGKLYGFLADRAHNQALDLLGEGLHSLQDMDAHSPEFQKMAEKLGVKYFYHDHPDVNGKQNLADDPEHKPIRLQNTERMSKAYFEAFIDETSKGYK